MAVQYKFSYILPEGWEKGCQRGLDSTNSRMVGLKYSYFVHKVCRLSTKKNYVKLQCCYGQEPQPLLHCTYFQCSGVQSFVMALLKKKPPMVVERETKLDK